jgi:uncharacterized membrane protein YkvA (DUF1232 family)
LNDQKIVLKGFWPKVRRLAGHVPFVETAVSMYYCAMDSDTPAWVKATIFAALAYFIFPIDAIPDFIVGAGYLDDAGAIATAFGAVRFYVTDVHKRKAREWCLGR